MTEQTSAGLAAKQCSACHGGVSKLNHEQITQLLPQLAGWQAAGGKLSRGFSFKNFVESIEFVNRIGRLAEEEGHHPDISFGWGYVEVELWTHAAGGLTENDFILAAKIDRL